MPPDTEDSLNHSFKLYYDNCFQFYVFFYSRDLLDDVSSRFFFKFKPIHHHSTQ